MNTLNGYSKSILTDKYVLTAAGGHLAVGNASNNIPLNNSTVNTNLNADMIDGYHASNLWRSDGGRWNPLASITLEATANGLEWSFDITRNGYTDCYWLVCDSSLNSMLKVTADDGKVSAPYGFIGNLSGNASSATKLQTPRTINGTSFDGSANITTNYWGVARTITLSGAVTGSASINGSLDVTITTTYQTDSIDGYYVGGKKTAEHGSQGTAYTADTYSSNFVNKAFVAYAERGSMSYANNGYITTDTGVNIPLAGTAIFQWGASDTNKTLLFITSYNNSGVSNPAANEMLFYTSNGSDYISAWTRVLTHRNYTTYTVTKTGEGASGTWGISITGSAPWANITDKPTLLTRVGITSLTNKNLNYAAYNFGSTNKGDDSAQLNVPANYGMYLSIAQGNRNQGGLIFFNTVPGTTGTLYFRTRNAGDGNTVDTWKPWKTVLDSTNYTAYFNPTDYVTALGTSGNYVTWTKNGSTNNLTVPYATTSSLLNNTSVSDPSTAASDLNLKWYSQVRQSSGYAGTNYGFPVSNNANGILWLGTHPGPYGWLMGFSSNGCIYARCISNNSFSTAANGGSWNRIAWTSDIPMVTNYYWANVKVSDSSSTSTSPTFSTAYASNWFRSTGTTGWYSETYGGGWYMYDSTYIRVYGSKRVYNDNTEQDAFCTSGGMTAHKGFCHSLISSNNYVLLAAGGYKSLDDFAKGNAGSATKGVYVTNGTITAMTYDLNATINSGSSNKLAYYSGTNSINSYTSTNGSSSTPIYLDAGVPTACTGVLVKLYANYDIDCTASSASFTKTNGNFSPISSVSRMGTGNVKINFASGYNWYLWFVFAVGKMGNSGNSMDNYTPRYVSLLSQSPSYLMASIQDDDTRNDGSFHFYILVF